MGDCWERRRAREAALMATAWYASYEPKEALWPAEDECDRAARNISFALAFVAGWAAAEHCLENDYYAENMLRRAGLWTERGES